MSNRSVFNNLTVKSKLQALFFAVSLGSIAVVGAISWYQGRIALL